MRRGCTISRRVSLALVAIMITASGLYAQGGIENRWNFTLDENAILYQHNDGMLIFTDNFKAPNIKVGLINSDGEVIVQPQWDVLRYQKENGHYISKIDNKYGVISKTGQTLIPNDFDNIEVLEDGSWRAIKENKTAIYNKDGSPIIPLK